MDQRDLGAKLAGDANGLCIAAGMLVDQAAENIRLWTGTRPDRAPMRAALEAALGM